jgi:hypothetical protein
VADPEEKKTAPETEQQNSEPETGAESAQEPNTQSVEPDTKTVKPEDSGEDKSSEPDDVAKWKAMSRKNEDNAKANLKRAEHAETERDSLRTENARLKVRMQYPQINDDALSLCSETEPEKIQEWADKYAKLNPLDTEPAKRDVREDAWHARYPLCRASAGLSQFEGRKGRCLPASYGTPEERPTQEELTNKI